MYGGGWTSSVEVNPQQAIANLLDRLEDPDPSTRVALSPHMQMEAFREAVAVRRQALDSDQDAGALADLDALGRMLEALPQGCPDPLEDSVVGILCQRMPTFFYFSDYQILPGRVDLHQLGGASQRPGATPEQTVRALLRLAGTDVGSLTEEDYEDRKAELEAVSNDLSQQVFQYWQQNIDLRVEIDIDKQTVTTSGPYGNEQQAVARYLDVRVRDGRHGYTNNFGQRSSGFQWFFSFLAAFSEFEHREDGVVVLLDEPGLTLHGKAQADFLRFIEERLAPVAQVIYTTHSPFMVDVAHLERVRVVEDRGPKEGAVVSAEALAVGDDSLFPLQAALGYDVASSLFIGEANLVVEGTSDFTYLTVISDHLIEQGRTGLDPGWRILPAGGATNVPAFVALIGRALDVTVLIDAGAKGMQRLEHLGTSGLLAKKRLLTVGMVTKTPTADIEDLFTDGDYLKLYNGAFATSVKVADLPAGTRLVDRISRHTGTSFTDHGKPADWLLRNRDKALQGLSARTLERFEALFRLVNGTRG